MLRTGSPVKIRERLTGRADGPSAKSEMASIELKYGRSHYYFEFDADRFDVARSPEPGHLAFGIGSSEVEHVLATQCLWQRTPRTMRVTVTGARGFGVAAKDVILAIIGRIGTGGGIGSIIEYRGSAIRSLSMEGRMTVCNMSIEAGAKAGLVAPDDVTFTYVEGRRHAPAGAAWEQALDDWRALPTDEGAASYARERHELAKRHGLEIFTVATHLQGQALGDEPTAKTLQFVGGEAVAAYKAWRDRGNEPPRTDPYYVPDEVGRMIHDQARRDLEACVRLAGHLSRLQNRKVALPGFVGSPANCWSHWFLFPPLPTSLGGHDIPDVRKVSLELLVERFKPEQNAAATTSTTLLYDGDKRFVIGETNELGHEVAYEHERGTGARLATIGPNRAGCAIGVVSSCPPGTLDFEEHRVRLDGLGRTIERFETFGDVRQLCPESLNRRIVIGSLVASRWCLSLEDSSEMTARQLESGGHRFERPGRSVALNEVVLKLANSLQGHSGAVDDLLLRQLQLVHSGVNRLGYGFPVLRHRHPS